MVERNYDRRFTTTPCRWALNSTEKSPHTSETRKPIPKICSSILDAVGNTPIVRINNLTKQENITCELLVKCEFLNPGGSVKDRIGIRIVNDLEKSGKLRPGMTIVEPTSGNTGIGIALAAVVKGYDMVVTMQEKISFEKSDLLQAMGCEIIRTPTEALFTDAHGFIGVAESLERNNETFIMPGQHFNPSNPLAHYDTTAEEIIEQLDGKLDYIVIGTGTGGQVTGLSRKLKEKIPGIVVVGVDPSGSIIHDPVNTPIVNYMAEGIGSKMLPRTCYTDLVDEWYLTDDKVTFEYARKMIRYEGLLVGGSAGAVMYGAIQLCKKLSPDKRVLVMIPDGIRNYMSKFLNDRWMIQSGFMKETETPAVEGKKIRDLNLKRVDTCDIDMTIRQVIQFMSERRVSEVPVLKNGDIIGAASSSAINKKLVSGKAVLDDLIEKVLVKGLKIMNFDTSLAFLAVWLEDWRYGIVKDGDFISVVYPMDLSLILGN